MAPLVALTGADGDVEELMLAGWAEQSSLLRSEKFHKNRG